MAFLWAVPTLSSGTNFSPLEEILPCIVQVSALQAPNPGSEPMLMAHARSHSGRPWPMAQGNDIADGLVAPMFSSPDEEPQTLHTTVRSLHVHYRIPWRQAGWTVARVLFALHCAVDHMQLGQPPKAACRHVNCGKWMSRSVSSSKTKLVLMR